MASGQPAVQTFVLRVSIHCHGCKKKVRKVLKSIEGVNDVKVDAQQHKVIVTGTVDAQTLIQRLNKSGKQALQWQNLHAAPAKDPEAAPAAQAPAPAPPAEDGGKNDAPVDKKPEEAVKEPQAESAEKKPEQEKKVEAEPEKETEPEKKAEKEDAKPGDEAKKDGGDSEAAETKAKGAEPVNEAAAAPAMEAGNDESEAQEKKQSKPKEAAAAAAASVDRSLPRHAPQEYIPYYAPQPQPVMSYNMAQPRQSVSYYAPQPEQAYSSMQQQPPAYSSMNMTQHPPPQQAYSQQGQPMQQWSPSYLYMPYPHASPESYYQDYYSPPGTHAPSPPPPPPLQDSYRLFDDENPNSCSVM